MRADERETVARVYWRAWHESHAPFIPEPIVSFRDLGFFRARVEAFGPAPVVALEGGTLVGFVLWLGPRLDQLWLLPEARGRGIGARLLRLAEAEMAALGHRRFELVCMIGNEGARRLYERHGWCVVGQFDKPLGSADGEIGVPVWRMEKALAPESG